MKSTIFRGNYIEALRAQNLSVEDFTRPVTPEINHDQINVDLPRLSFLGYPQEKRIFNQVWRASEDLSYAQGNMDGRVFQNTHFKARCLGVADSAALMDLSLEKLETVEIKEFAASYIDDAGHLSGFSLVYNVLNPLQWEIAIIRRANLSPESRDVFLMSHLDLTVPYPLHQLHKGDPNDRMKREFHSDKMARLFQDIIGSNGQVRPGVLNIVQTFVLPGNENAIDDARTIEPSPWINAREVAVQNMAGQFNSHINAPDNLDILTPALHAYLTQKVDALRRKAGQLKRRKYHDAANELTITAKEIEHHLEIAFALDTFANMRNSDLQRAELQMIQTTINNVSPKVKELPGVVGLLKHFVDFVYKKTGIGKNLVRFFKNMREKELDDVSESFSNLIQPVAAA